MPIYEFYCGVCGNAENLVCSIAAYETRRDSPPICCDASMLRRFSLGGTQIKDREHYSNAIGEYVSNDRTLRSSLSRLSDQTSERLGGMKVDLQPIHPEDARSFVKPDALESDRKRRRDKKQLSGKATTETSRNPKTKAKRELTNGSDGGS